ncbi:MAG: polyphosphate kinase 1 [Geminicoccaceae bacterium]
MTAEEAEDHLLHPEARQATSTVARASVAATKSRKKASQAADRTAHAAQSVADTKAATKATLAEAKREHPRTVLSRAIATADKEAKLAKKAAAAAEEMAMRAAGQAGESERAAAVAREAETSAIKAVAKAKGAEIEVAQAERADKPALQAIKAAKQRLARLRKETEAKEAEAEAAALKVAALASEAKAEATAAARKVEETARAVKRTEIAARKAEGAVSRSQEKAERSLSVTKATVGEARSATKAAVDDTRASAKAAKKLESAAAQAHAEAASASKAEAERAAGRAKAAAEQAARSEAETGKNLRAPELYLNRELTWLNFNKRVLHEAEDKRTPLLERVKFLAIVGSNLDEFFMKRIGGLKQQVGAGMHELTVDGRTPQAQIHDSVELVREIQARARTIFLDLKAALRRHDIVIADYADLLEEEQAGVRAYYIENIFPLVTPLAMDPAHPFPHISNLSLNLLAALRAPGEATPILARVKVPTGAAVPRFIRVGSANKFVPLEDVMANNLDVLFPDVEVMSCELFRVTRNANTEIEEETADDLLAMIESEVRDRKFAPIVRLETIEGVEPLHRGMLAAELGLDEEEDVFESDVMLGMRDLFEIASIDIAELHDTDHHGIDHVDLDGEQNIFHAIRNKGPLLLHHPYESFNTSVVRFVREACRDPKVMAIKMTLYRTTTDIVDYLIEAARNGKQVAVAVELKARFDEAANINWATRLEEAGVHVTYGVVGLKTHAKLILVIRRDFSGLRHYAHIGTGNYHAGTARLYADFGLLTGNQSIGGDLVEFFNFLTSGCQPHRRYSKILVSPRNMKAELLAKINREISNQSARSPGLIRLKTNALEDPDITEALYRASRVGVKVELMIRDTCRLRPGIPGLSDNVTVISVVGRFLEHARVYYFQNGGDEEFYIGSADLMMRNLESRAEVIVAIEDEPLRDELRRCLDMQLCDGRNVWDMLPDGSYVQRRPKSGEAEARPGCQQAMIDAAQQRHQEALKTKMLRPRAIARRTAR